MYYRLEMTTVVFLFGVHLESTERDAAGRDLLLLEHGTPGNQCIALTLVAMTLADGSWSQLRRKNDGSWYAAHVPNYSELHANVYTRVQDIQSIPLLVG